MSPNVLRECAQRLIEKIRDDGQLIKLQIRQVLQIHPQRLQ